MAVADAACAAHAARGRRRRRARGGQRRPAAARRRRDPHPAVRAGPGGGVAARVVGDAGVLAGRLGGAGHRGHQPRHRRTPHRGASGRPGRGDVARRAPRPPRWRGCSPTPGAATRRSRCSSNSADRRSGAGRRRRGSGRRDRRATSTTSTSIAVRYLPDERSLRCCPTTRSPTTGRSPSSRCAPSRWPRSAPRPGELLWDVGAGSGSIAIEWCRSGPGCRGGRIRTRRATPQADRATTRRRSAPASTCDSTRQRRSTSCRPPAAIFIGGGLTRAGTSRRLLRAAARRRPAGGQRGDCRVGSRSRAVVFARSAASCADSSTTAASRSASSPAGVPRCPSRSGWSRSE